MSRGTRTGLALAVFAIGSAGAAIVAARHARTDTPAAAAPPAQTDPAWCGSPLPPAVPLDASTCRKMSMTGAAPECVFWAECGDVQFSVDCARAGRGLCRCPSGRLVAYEAAFCALDATDPQRSLRSILEAGARACR